MATAVTMPIADHQPPPARRAAAPFLLMAFGSPSCTRLRWPTIVALAIGNSAQHRFTLPPSGSTPTPFPPLVEAMAPQDGQSLRLRMPTLAAALASVRMEATAQLSRRPMRLTQRSCALGFSGTKSAAHGARLTPLQKAPRLLAPAAAASAAAFRLCPRGMYGGPS